MSIDKEMDIINKHMNTLKYWSKKSTSNVLFDSKVDGDGTNNELYDKVFNKSNLYFISFDENNNVYGGYINTKIDKSGNDTSNLRYYINDENAFVFSLIKDGEVNKKRYYIKKGKKSAFLLFNYELDSWLDNANPDGALYRFGNDIISCDISDNYSWCTDGMDKYSYYYYYNDDNPFTDVTAPETFKVRRIIVLKMKN
ncbi:TLDc domain-containing protein [Entamoeba marina]